MSRCPRGRLIGIAIRLFAMVATQQHRERMNRPINERLRALIAAYKTLGGSFTSDLTADSTPSLALRGVDGRFDAAIGPEYRS
ncbi:hypothetical protein FTO74_06485 [Granulicella sp. WH15]|nr:hypothetical protein FTO74_06485 [Granulicella sp. WH15]